MHPPDWDTDLETLARTELRRLPQPRAPHTLLPRVVAAVQAWTMRPWYSRAWFTWPVGWQVVTIAALILLAAGGAVLLPGARAAMPDAASTIALGVKNDLASVAQHVAIVTNVAGVLWRALLEPIVPYAFALVVLMCLACAAFGAALNRVAFGEAVQQ